MRTILRYVDGRPIWSENTPGANPGSSKIGGHLVVGGPNEHERRAAEARRYKEKLAAAKEVP